ATTRATPTIHSFPTRRSSDLNERNISKPRNMKERRIEKANGMAITSERIPHVLERLNEPSHGQGMVNSHRPFLNVTSGTKEPFWLPCWRCMFLASPLEKFRKSSKRSVENPSLNPLFQR